jgi:hypothetical protein
MHRDSGTRPSMIDLPFVTMGLRSRYPTCGVIVIHRIVRIGSTQTIGTTVAVKLIQGSKSRMNDVRVGG